MSATDAKIAVIGCGRWGKNLIRVCDDIADVVLCCHQGGAQNRQWMEDTYPSIPLTTSFEQVLDADLDAAVVVTPIGTHYSLTKQLLQQDIPTFVEKPLTADPASATELSALARDRQTVLFVGYIFVHHPVFQRLKTIHNDSPFAHVELKWHKRRASNTDIIANLASHDIALLYHLFGTQPDSLTRTSSVQALGAHNIVSIQAEFEVATCRIHLNRVDNQKRKTGTFVTTSGDIYLWDDHELYYATTADPDFETVFSTEKEPLKVEVRRFLDCVETDRTPVTDGQFGATVTTLFDGLSDPSSD